MAQPINVGDMPEMCAPLNVVRRIMAENRSAGAADVMRHFQGALEGKLEQVQACHVRRCVQWMRATCRGADTGA